MTRDFWKRNEFCNYLVSHPKKRKKGDKISVMIQLNNISHRFLDYIKEVMYPTPSSRECLFWVELTKLYKQILTTLPENDPKAIRTYFINSSQTLHDRLAFTVGIYITLLVNLQVEMTYSKLPQKKIIINKIK